MAPHGRKSPPRSSEKQISPSSKMSRSTISNRATNNNADPSSSPSKRSSMRQAKKNVISAMLNSTKPPASTQDKGTTTQAKKQQKRNPSRDSHGRFQRSRPASSSNIKLSTPASKKAAAKATPIKKPLSIRKTPRKKKATSPGGFTTPSPALHKKQRPRGTSSSKRHHPSPNSTQWSRSSAIVLANIGLGGKKNSSSSQKVEVLRKKLKVVTHISLGHKSTFVVRLFAMMHYSHEHSPDICHWVHDGTSIEMWPKHPGVGDLLAKFFQHSNFLSFQRQLNNYGFIRVSNAVFELSSIVYYHAHLHAESDPDTLPNLIKYQGGRSPVKKSIGSPRPAANSIADPRRSSPKSASKKKNAKAPSTTGAVSTKASIPKKILFSPTKKEALKKKSGEPKKKPSKKTAADSKKAPALASVKTPAAEGRKRSSSRDAKPLAKRVKVASPKKDSEDKRVPLPPPSLATASRASSIVQFSRFHRMRSIGSASTYEEPAPVALRFVNHPMSSLAANDSSSVRLMNGNASDRDSALRPPPFAFAVTGTPVVSNRKMRNMTSRPVPFSPPQNQYELGPPTPDTLSSPTHYAMLSAFLETPSPQKQSSSTPGKDGVRLLFHAAEAVEHSPMLLADNAKYASLSSPSCMAPDAASDTSPITSMINMDATSFRYAMDALHGGD